jgi:phosphate uptake regulator
MKRKAIQLASNTLVVSLPAKWVRQNNISKGSELDIDVKEKMLVLRKDSQESIELNTVYVDISGMSASLMWNFLSSIYHTGVSEIEISFSDQAVMDIKTGETKKTMDVISRITDKLIGMEIIRQSKNSCVLKEITSMKGEEYQNVLNRIFLSLSTMADDVLIAVRNQDTATLENIHLYSEININKLSDYCMRILNMEGLKDFKESNSNYLMTFLLEEVGDAYAEIARIMCSGVKKKFAAETQELYEKTTVLLQLAHKLFLNPKKEYYIEFHEERNNIKKKIDSLIRSEKKYDDEILVFLKIILDKLMEFGNSRLTAIDGFSSTHR